MLVDGVLPKTKFLKHLYKKLFENLQKPVIATNGHKNALVFFIKKTALVNENNSCNVQQLQLRHVRQG